ncbi:MAG TPA: adenylate kinase [Candidatus Binataceae bacterium]|nr:adenylate kinase [Candidatus Binataceae bacterium]
MRVVLLGPPGAGKGTQAKMLEDELNIPQIASGDLLRIAVRNKSALGQEARRYMERGALVPDELVLRMIEERLQQRDTQGGFVLDGFPRTLAQAEALRLTLERAGGPLDLVLALLVSDEEVVRRISGRRTCRTCGAIYHLIFDPPRNINVCDRCQGELYQRDDDAEETVRNRLATYHRQTKPLLDYYERQGLLRSIDGQERMEAVHERIMAALGAAAQRA